MINKQRHVNIKNSNTKATLMKKIITAVSLVCMTSSALAGGYRVSIQGQKALGMGHTGVAISESSEVVFFNPSGMSFLEPGMEMTGGITFLDGTTKYQNTTTNTAAETDSPIGTPINFYFTSVSDEPISYGVGLYTPYGNSVEWTKDWVGSHLVNNIELKAIYIQPTIAYKINDQYSVGFGPTYVNGQVEFNRNLSTALVDANGDRSNVTIEASGVNAWGYNLGFTAIANEQLTIGFSYRSEVTLEARGGSASFQSVPTSQQALFSKTTFDADLVLPAELTLGLAYKLSPETTLAFDINRTYWSAFKSLDIKFANSVPDSINPRNYNDSSIYRFGVQHKMSDKFTARGGLYLDKTPISDGFYTPETARNDALSYTAGGTYTLSENTELDFSLLIVTFDEFNGAYTPQSFNGSYKTSATSIGAGFNYRF